MFIGLLATVIKFSFRNRQVCHIHVQNIGQAMAGRFSWCLNETAAHAAMRHKPPLNAKTWWDCQGSQKWQFSTKMLKCSSLSFSLLSPHFCIFVYGKTVNPVIPRVATSIRWFFQCSSRLRPAYQQEIVSFHYPFLHCSCLVCRFIGYTKRLLNL